MARMSKQQALNLCAEFGIVPMDWHIMTTSQKERVLKAADSRKYRKPKNANGSRGRYFCEYINRALQGE